MLAPIKASDRKLRHFRLIYTRMHIIRQISVKLLVSQKYLFTRHTCSLTLKAKEGNNCTTLFYTGFFLSECDGIKFTVVAFLLTAARSLRDFSNNIHLYSP